jgi:predicted ATP-dependent endonuclease of OLD family
MKRKSLYISGYKNLNNFQIDFENRKGITVLIGNNGSGKSNILEAISAIFTCLYKIKQRRFKANFNFKIEYQLNNQPISIELNDAVYKFSVNNIVITKALFKSNPDRYLPSQIICSYSGEEDRIWEWFYSPFYNQFRKAVRSRTLQSIPTQQLFYVNKFYWQLALLTFIYSSQKTGLENIANFLRNDMQIRQIDQILISFDVNRLRQFDDDVVVLFVKRLNPNFERQVSFTIEQLGQMDFGFEREFFHLLAAAFMPKPGKLITSIDIKFNGGLNIKALSEGEKKLLLIKCILEFLTDENSLILLDEPDSHIHISRKQNLKALLKEYENRENIITTHSPTLTHCFEMEHIAMLTKDDQDFVKLESKDKQQVIAELTNDIWSYQEQNIFLSSNKDIILVEGKTDIAYIQTAINKFKSDNPEYDLLDFEFLPFGGASGLKLFIEKFTPRRNQLIIALLDRDQAGLDSIKEVFTYNGTMAEYTTRKKNGIDVVLIPKADGYLNENFIIEDYYGIEYLKSIMFKDAGSLTSVLKDNALKREIERRCKNDEIEKSQFVGFKKLLDELLRIKRISLASPELDLVIAPEAV